MAVNFYLDKRVDKKGDSPIRVSVAIRGTRLLTSTGLKVASCKWNAKKQRVKHGVCNSAGMPYNILNAVLARIADCFAAYEADSINNAFKPGTEDLKAKLCEVMGRGSGHSGDEELNRSVLEWLDVFVKEQGRSNQWSRATVQKFMVLRKHLENFSSRNYGGKLEFTDFTESGLNAFVAFLRDERQMKNTTVVKQLGLVKWFMRWATSKGVCSTTAFQSFSPKIKTSGKKVIFLEWSELMKVFGYEVPENGTVVTLTDSSGRTYSKTIHDSAAIAKTRDIFCFCCFTSLRYSDAANLKHSDFHGDSFTVTTIKTADTITIELNKFALEILERYKDCSDFNGYVFPHITNQRMNIYLKDLCELCGINRLVTQTYYRGAERVDETVPKYMLIGTHCGRRTFICNALMLGIPAEIVMKWTGHSDYNSMKPYIAVADAAKAKAMNLFNRLGEE